MKKREKIMFFITGLGAGGAENQLYRIISNLDKEKFEPIVISLIDKGVVGEKFIKDKIKLYELNINTKGKIESIISFYNILKYEKPKILVCFLYHAIILGRIIGKFAKVPYIISSIRNINSGGKIRDLLMRFTDFLSITTTTNSFISAKSICEKKIVSEKKMVVITNGIDINNFKPNNEVKNKFKKDYKISEDVFLWVAVGRLEQQKNYKLMINAFAEVSKHRKVKLLILGEGELRSEYEELINNLELNDKIELIGVRKDIQEFLNIADGFVMSSSWEGMPNVIMEAQALGKIVVATKVGGVPELVINNETGFLVENNDLEGLIKKIIYVIDLNEEKKDEISKNARKHIIDNYSITCICEKWEELFLSLINDNK